MKKLMMKYKSVILCLLIVAALTGLVFFLTPAKQVNGRTVVNSAGVTNKPAASISLEVENSPAKPGNTGEGTPADTDPNSQPALTSRVSSGPDSVTFSWASILGAKGYEVYRSDTENDGFVKIGTLADTVYKDTGLTIGKSYYYKVRAYFSEGTSTAYGAFTEVFSITPVPLSPKTLRAEFSGGGIELTWSAVEGAAQYEIYRSNTPDGEFKRASIVNTTSFLDNSSNPKQTFYYKVRAGAFAKDGTLIRGAFTIEEYAVKGDITDKCTFTSSVNTGSFGDAIDNQYKTAWDSGKAGDRYIDISVGNNYKAGGIYLVWETPPQSWDLYGISGGKSTLITHGGKEKYLTQFVYIPSGFSGYGDFRLVLNAAETDVSLAEISVFTPGNVPYYAPLWQPFAGRADILTIVAHPDDEDLYMSAPAPYYTNQGKRCVTAFMSYCTENRRYEGQESAWTLGNKNYPVMRYAEDVKTDSIEGALKYWPLDDCVSYIVEQIRKYKPSVIVTHDVNGEYGHGAHRLTEYAVELAFQAAGDPDQYPDSAKKYGTWKPGKLYVHLEKNDALNLIDVNKSLKAFGGRTDYQVALDAYARHKSQLGRRAISKSGGYDMRAFGLKLTNLGEDNLHDSMFENVTEEAMLALNPWYGEKAADRSMLEDALKEAKSESETYFTPASWISAGLEKAITEAQTVYENAGAAQYQVEAEAAALYADIGMLVPA